MASLLPALNDHIRRLARREIRAQTKRSKKAAAQHRRDIAALKRTIKVLTSRLIYVERQRSGKAALVTATASAESLRFRADGLRSHRARLGLSAKDFGKLVGVSGLTIYHWEAGRVKPRRRQLAALSQVRKLGKKDALRRLDEV